MKNKRLFVLMLSAAMTLGSVPSVSFASAETPMEAAAFSSGSETTEPAGEQQETTPEVTPEIIPETTPEITPEITPETTPEITPEVTPEITPETTPEITPE